MTIYYYETRKRKTHAGLGGNAILRFSSGKLGSDDDRFVAVPVVPGVSKGGWTAVEGLPDGDVEVVVAGAYELRIAVMSKESGVKTTGHFHADGQFHEGEDE